LEAQGDFLDHEYTFTRGGEPVAQVSKRWLSIRDSYAIDVAAGEDDVLLLACAVVVDMACHKEEGHHH
ncbi:MAG: LURP-one-related/scramblase family protein, partial [Thermoanaerobaculia bacterium]